MALARAQITEEQGLEVLFDNPREGWSALE